MEYLFLLATLLFVFGIKRLTSVRTCAQGNKLSELEKFYDTTIEMLPFDFVTLRSVLK